MEGMRTPSFSRWSCATIFCLYASENCC